MLSARARISAVVKRALATAVEQPKVPNSANKKYKVVVVGGGPGGLSVSSTLSEILGKNQVAIIEPSAVHYYQPLWTYVGAGLKSFDESQRPMASVIPLNADWIQNSVNAVEPGANTVVLADGKRVAYDYLVVATGIQPAWEKVKGLREALGKDSVTSNYSPETVLQTRRFIEEFKGGNAIFTFPPGAIKCPGAPVKIAFFAEETFRINGVRSASNILYNTAAGKIFGNDYFGIGLQKVADDRNIRVNIFQELVEVRPADRTAIFKDNTPAGAGALNIVNYDLLHVSPTHTAPSFIRDSGIGDAAGFVDVSKETMRHNKFPNIYALGDCSSVPTSKTATAITGESAVLKHNLLAAIEGRKVEDKAYDGYASCPLITGRNSLILAEFSGFTGQPMETFPVDQRLERSSAQFLNKEIIPEIYWSGLLRGKWEGPARYRNLFAPFRSAN
ncbi:hypothetical protein BC938DRAFT_473508 [Jimgerdemannia flammicorona]|uniref:Sulfide:quinone oxidoreductase, mitochondrial n=1 Tax=Jimgerdemannia flammicorona TaxID=994334 RepID=A0A433Q3Y4_9FUNG|nr:hypothetical protein BC938DRAFT_473508 [Jimgerdemannia flammicorona]